MPSAIISRERVYFVDDNRLNAAEQRLVFDTGRNQHHFERFRRRKEHIRRFRENGSSRSIAHIAVPHRGPTAAVRCVTL